VRKLILFATCAVLFGAQGQIQFEEIAQKAGLRFELHNGATGRLHQIELMPGGVAAFDFDNDGWRDLFFAVSHFPSLDRYLGKSAAQANRVFRNLRGRRFEDVSSGAGADFQLPAMYHGTAFADFDNDGRVDAVVTSLNGPVKLFRNVTNSAGHWLVVRLRGARSNRQGLGAELRATLPDGRDVYGTATTSVGYASSSEALVRFGLGANESVSRVEVRWPVGATQQVSGVKADRVIEIQEERR
jgi:hypothetical protein